MGNLLSKVEEDKTTNYTFNQLNQLITEDVYLNNILTSNKIYTYDANGNNTSIVDESNNIRESLIYDVSNQLITYTKLDSNISSVQSNKYNASGKRIQKIENNKKTNYFYLNDSLLYTLDENTNITSHNMMDPNGDIFATIRINNNEKLYYIYNKNIIGSVTNIINEDGSPKVSYEYSDFGETKTVGNTDFYNEICYTSGIYDGLSNLYYLNARYYNPTSVRFMTIDTYRGDLKDSLSLNFIYLLSR